MQIYYVDETGISTIHKPAKVVTELEYCNAYSLTFAERGKTPTVLSCVSTSGHNIIILPPVMMYPQK